MPLIYLQVMEMTACNDCSRCLNSHQMDRKCAVLGKRPTPIERTSLLVSIGADENMYRKDFPTSTVFAHRRNDDAPHPKLRRSTAYTVLIAKCVETLQDTLSPAREQSRDYNVKRVNPLQVHLGLRACSIIIHLDSVRIILTHCRGVRPHFILG